MLTRMCLAAAVLCTLAVGPTAAQDRGPVLERRVTVTFREAPLESVLRTLHRQYGVRMSYSSTALNLRQTVTYSAQNLPLRTVLDALLRDRNIGYELVGDQLVLHPVAPARSAAPAPPASPATGRATSNAPSRPAETSRAAEPARPASAAATGAVGAARSTAPATEAKSTAAAKHPTSAPATAPAEKSATTAAHPAAGSHGPAASTADAATPAPTAATPVPPAEATAAAPNNASEVPASAAAASPAPAPADSATAAVAAATPAPVDSVAAPAELPAPPLPQLVQPAQISLLGPLGSNGLQSARTVNHVSVNILGGLAAGVDGFEAGGLFNVDLDTVKGVQVAGLANVVGRNLRGFQGAGLFNLLGGEGQGWQAAGLLNVATRPMAGAQTAGLFNYAGPAKDTVPAELTASAAPGVPLLPAPPALAPPTVQAAGLFNVAFARLRGAQVAGLLNIANKVHGVQLAGLLNIADSVQGVSIAPFNFVRHGYHRVEVLHGNTWPVSASLKLGGSAAFYTFLTGAYDGFSGLQRWGIGYGIGTEAWARRRFSLSFDISSMHVNEEQGGFTRSVNQLNQLRLLFSVTPFRPSSHVRIVGGPMLNMLITHRYDAAEGGIYSSLIANQHILAESSNATTRVLAWAGYSVGLRF